MVIICSIIVIIFRPISYGIQIRIGRSNIQWARFTIIDFLPVIWQPVAILILIGFIIGNFTEAAAIISRNYSGRCRRTEVTAVFYAIPVIITKAYFLRSVIGIILVIT